MLACFVFKSDAKVLQTFRFRKKKGLFFAVLGEIWAKSGNFAAQNSIFIMKTAIIRTLLAIVLFATAATAGAAGSRLFHIARSLNRNIVCYDVQLAGGQLDQKRPIHVYWHNNEDHPGRESDISAMERKLAYGYNVKSVSAQEAVVALTAYGKRTIKICKQGGKWVALININGKECQLSHIYVKTKTAVSVDYIELHGKPTAGGPAQKETIRP